MLRDEILEEARSLINRDRQATYGTARDSFGRIGKLWGAYLNTTPFEAYEVAAMLALMKISRTVVTPEKGDTWTDLAGYAALGGELANEV